MIRFRHLPVLLAIACLGITSVLFVTQAASEDGDEPQPDACRTAGSVGEAVTEFGSAMAGNDIERLEATLPTEFTRGVFVGGPASVIPRVPGVRPTRTERGGPYTWRYRGFAAPTPEKLLELKRQIGRIPFRFTQIALTPPVASREYADFAFTGRGTGPPWRRALQVAGKGAINCDGTVLLLVLDFRGGNTPIPRLRGWCRDRRNLAVVSGARICAQSRYGYRSWRERANEPGN